MITFLLLSFSGLSIVGCGYKADPFYTSSPSGHDDKKLKTIKTESGTDSL
jgi:hypothetical protein